MENVSAGLAANLKIAQNFGSRCAYGVIRSESWDGETEPEILAGLKSWARAERQYLDWLYETYRLESLP